MYGGQPMYDDGTEIEIDAEKRFAKAHYEQHGDDEGHHHASATRPSTRRVRVCATSRGVRGTGRPSSWYRWLPMVFDEDFAMMLSIVGRTPATRRAAGWCSRTASTT